MLSAIGISATDSTAAEGLENNYGAWQITRGGSLEFSCAIYFRLTGTASYGSDYSITPSTGGYVSVSSTTYDSTTGTSYTEGCVSFSNHVSTVTLQLIPYNDSAKEVQETAILQLTRYVCFQDDVQLSGSASITIQDNDNWTVSAAATDAAAKESHVNAPNYGVYTIARSGETDTTYSLNTRFQLTGTAFASNDYSIYTETGNLVSLSTSYDQTTQDPIYTGNVVIPAGQMSVTLELRPNNDAEKELAENVTLTMLPSYSELGNGAYTVTGSPVTIVIEDNDDWVVSVAATDNEAAECPLPAKNYGVYTITRANETDTTHSLSVSFQMTRTAALSDYSFYTLSGNTVNLSSQYDQTTQSTIYTGSVTIPAGQTFVELELRPNNDAEREQLETAVLTLRPSYSEYGYGAYTLAASSSSTVSIEDNDDWVVSVAAADNEAAECPLPEKNYGVYTITRANETDTTYPLSVSFQMTGTASLSDYSLFTASGNAVNISSLYDQTTQSTVYTGSVSIPAGPTSVTLELRPNNDAEREELETAVLTLRPSYSEYGYGAYSVSPSSSTASISIEDNDQWSVAVTAIDNTTSEGSPNNTRIFKIERNDETDVSFPISVPFTMSGSATTADYSLHTSSGSSISLSPFWNQTTQTYVYSGYISIPADAFNVTVELRPIDDTYAESDETAIMTIQPSLYYEIDPDNGEADITIEETTVVTLTTLDDVALEPCTWIPGNERNGAFRLTVYTTEIDRSAITVQLNVAGTAIPGYNGSSGDYHLTKNPNGGSSSDIISVSNGLASLTLPGNQDVLDFYAMPNGDALFEIDENVVLALAQAYSGMQSNQAECVDDEVEAVYILQAPEFISGNDPSPPTNVNADSYVKYIDPEAKFLSLFGGEEITAAIPSGRTCRYAFYDAVNGNSSESSTSNPLLRINESTGFITVLRKMTEEELASSPSFTIKAYDSLYNQLYDLATISIIPAIVDLDIDSDNYTGNTPSLGTYTMPERTAREDLYESHSYGFGKVMIPNWNDVDNDGILDCWDGYSLDNQNVSDYSFSMSFYPVVLEIPQGMSLDVPCIRFHYTMASVTSPANPATIPSDITEGAIRLWKKDGYESRNGNNLIHGGDLITNSVLYTPRQLGFTDLSTSAVIYVEAITENYVNKHVPSDWKFIEQNIKPTTSIRVEVNIGNIIFEDEVRYIISHSDPQKSLTSSFWFNVLEKEELRMALASSAIYNRDTLPNFGMQLLQIEELMALGIEAETRILLSNAISGDYLTTVSGQPTAGFNAGVYYDHLSGKAVLAFAGSDDLGDWGTNISQALELSEGQYGVAISIASELLERFGSNQNFVSLANSTPCAPTNFSITGHSLGGGLARTAMYVTGFTTRTFNSAGLSDTTIRLADEARTSKHYQTLTNNIPLLEYVTRDDPIYRHFGGANSGCLVFLDNEEELGYIEPHLRPQIFYGLMRSYNVDDDSFL